MADNDKLSITEILAAARKQDGDAAAPEAGAAPAESPKPADEQPAAPAQSAAPAAKPGQMSVADMLAAARSSDAGGSDADESAPQAPA